jgi:hypothetical protein
MGILNRLGLRNPRTETATRLGGAKTGANKNAPPTFVPELIRSETWNSDEPTHLLDVAMKDPVASYLTYKLAENTFDDWFRLVDLNGKEILLDAQKEFILLDAQRALTQALANERIFGYSYLYTGKNRYIPTTKEGGRIASLYCLNPIECVVWEYDEVGNPKTMELKIEVGQGKNSTVSQKLYLPAEDFIFINTRPIGRGYKGRSALLPVWDMLTYLRYEYHSMAFYDGKIGHGIFAVTVDGTLTDAAKSKMDAELEEVSAKRALIIENDVIEKIEFVGANPGSTDFEAHIDACLKLIAAGTAVPKDIFTGATAGAITGSETNIKALFAVLNQIQTSMEPYIRELIRRMGFTNTDYHIAWNVRYAHDEEEQSKILMNNAQTLAIRSQWLTINEIRAEEGLGPVPDGDKLKSEFNINVAGMPSQTQGAEQTPDERDATHNPEGVNI